MSIILQYIIKFAAIKNAGTRHSASQWRDEQHWLHSLLLTVYMHWIGTLCFISQWYSIHTYHGKCRCIYLCALWNKSSTNSSRHDRNSKVHYISFEYESVNNNSKCNIFIVQTNAIRNHSRWCTSQRLAIAPSTVSIAVNQSWISLWGDSTLSTGCGEREFK